MGELVWPLAGTHCVWCGELESHRHGVHCSAVASRGGGEFGRMAVACELRALVEAQAAVIARLRAGWDEDSFAVDADEDAPAGEWVNFTDDDGVSYLEMTRSEQIVLYGEVVRTEEADTVEET